jgi:chromosome segregation ATPase
LTDQIKALFETLPNTVDEIDDAIHAAKAKADLNYSYNPKIIEQYNQRQEEIDDLRAKLAQETRDLQEKQQKIEETKVCMLYHMF